MLNSLIDKVEDAGRNLHGAARSALTREKQIRDETEKTLQKSMKLIACLIRDHEHHLMWMRKTNPECVELLSARLNTHRKAEEALKHRADLVASYDNYFTTSYDRTTTDLSEWLQRMNPFQ